MRVVGPVLIGDLVERIHGHRSSRGVHDFVAFFPSAKYSRFTPNDRERMLILDTTHVCYLLDVANDNVSLYVRTTF